MLRHLKLFHFSIVTGLELDFKSGFTVLTGETGAGKSVISNALNLISGELGSDGFIQTDQQVAVIEATLNGPLPVFLSSYVNDDNTVCVARKLFKSKPSIARLNDENITLKNLKKGLSSLILLVNQHEATQLCHPNYQLMWIDSDPHVSEQLCVYRHVYARYQDLKKQIDDLNKQLSIDKDQLEFLKFQVDDLKSQQFVPQEDDDLQEKKMVIKKMDALKKTGFSFQDHLAQSDEHLKQALYYLQKLMTDYPEFSEKYQDLYSAKSLIEKSFLPPILQPSKELNIDDIEARLDCIFRYKQKYKCNNIHELLMLQNRLEAKLTQQESKEDQFSDLNLKYDAVLLALKEAALKLHHARLLAKTTLESKLVSALQQLHFSYVNLEINLQYNPDVFLESGSNSIEFLISFNPSEPLKPLHKVASGGELSRVLLALYSEINIQASCIFFDEIDTGIGGMTALSIGQYLKRLSERKQVICITHLAQVARYADHHIAVKKTSLLNSTSVEMAYLSDQQREEELKRMIGGLEVSKVISS